MPSQHPETISYGIERHLSRHVKLGCLTNVVVAGVSVPPEPIFLAAAGTERLVLAAGAADEAALLLVLEVAIAEA